MTKDVDKFQKVYETIVKNGEDNDRITVTKRPDRRYYWAVHHPSWSLNFTSSYSQGKITKRLGHIPTDSEAKERRYKEEDMGSFETKDDAIKSAWRYENKLLHQKLNSKEKLKKKLVTV